MSSHNDTAAYIYNAELDTTVDVDLTDLPDWAPSLDELRAVPTVRRHLRQGRPPIGERVEVRLPADMLTAIDQHAASNSMTRAEAIRDLLTKTVNAPAVD